MSTPSRTAPTAGELTTVPPTGETRAQILADYCAAEGLRLEESVAYADSTRDLPMLEAVGFPVAVNPETRLAAIARKRGWLVEHWSKAPAGRARCCPSGRCCRPAARALSGDSGARAARLGRSMKALRVRAQAGPLRRRPRRPGRWRPARGATVGPLTPRPTSSRPTCPARTGSASARVWPASAGATCRRSTARRQPLLRADRQLPVHPRPRGRGRHRRRPTGRARAGAAAAWPAASTRRARPAPRGDLGSCERLAFGHLDAGLQSGFCCDTGGGWSTTHDRPPQPARSPCPTTQRRGRGDGRADRVRRPRRAPPPDPRGDTVVVLGAGTLGLLTIAALAAPARRPASSSPRPATPSSDALADELGADTCASPTSCRASSAASRELDGATATSSPAVPTSSRLRRRLRLARRRPSPSCGPGGTVVAGRHAGAA